MNSISGTTVNNASSAEPGSVQGAAAVSVLKSALNLQASAAAQLIQSVQPPALALSGTVGTVLHAVA